MDKNEELFKGITFSDLMSDVYHNSKRKDRQINQLIENIYTTLFKKPPVQNDNIMNILLAQADRVINTSQNKPINHIFIKMYFHILNIQ